MRHVIIAATVLAAVAPAAPVLALTAAAPPIITEEAAPKLATVQYDPYVHHHHHHPRYGGYVGPHGGYRINRYGYGNYVSGPTGGFAGYPPGSAGARIYRQQGEWKCQSVPETC